MQVWEKVLFKEILKSAGYLDFNLISCPHCNLVQFYKMCIGLKHLECVVRAYEVSPGGIYLIDVDITSGFTSFEAELR